MKIKNKLKVAFFISIFCGTGATFASTAYERALGINDNNDEFYNQSSQYREIYNGVWVERNGSVSKKLDKKEIYDGVWKVNENNMVEDISSENNQSVNRNYRVINSSTQRNAQEQTNNDFEQNDTRNINSNGNINNMGNSRNQNGDTLTDRRNNTVINNGWSDDSIIQRPSEPGANPSIESLIID